MKSVAVGLIFFLCFIFLLGCDLRTDLFDKSNLKKSDLKVENCSPQDQSADVPFDTRISVWFSHQMNRESVYRSFHLSFNGEELGRNDGHFEWFDHDRVFIFTPFASFPPSTMVNVTLDSEAMDVDERHLLKGHSWCFRTAESENPTPLTAELLSPDVTEMAVDIYPHIIIRFSRQVLLYTAYTTFRLRSVDGTDVRIVTDGEVLCDGTTFIFTPTLRLREETDYVVEFIRIFKNGCEVYLEDLSGNTLEITFPSFHTTGNLLYVSPNGDDLDSGLENHPKRTIGSAIARAQELGFDTTIIMIADGDYHENVILEDNIDLMGGFQGDDFQNRDYQTVLYPLTNESTLQIIDVAECTIDGLIIHGNGGALAENATVLIDGGSSTLLIERCEVESSSGIASSNYGIWISNSSYVTMNNNTINCEGGASSCGIYINNSENISILDSEVYGGSGAISCGVLLENSENATITGTTLHGGSGNVNCGLFIDNTNAEIFGNDSISGGAGSKNTGIVVHGPGNRSIIQSNNRIEGGETGEVCGIVVSGFSSPVIQDNAMITGGSTSSNDATGIRVEDRSTPLILRNTIVGGRTISGEQNRTYGVRYVNDTAEKGEPCTLFNNFIAGGKLTTQVSDKCYGVYVKDREVYITNNTIDGGGNPYGYGYTFGIFCKDSGSTWSMHPVIINNYILGGNSVTSHGIYIYERDEENLSCAIYNNIFNANSCVFYAYTEYGSTGDIDALNTGLGASLFEPDPKSNYEDSASPSTVFRNISSADYHIRTATYPPVQNRGYWGEYDPSYLFLYAQEGALLDIDGQIRETGSGTDYNLIDLGADELLP